MVFDLCRLVYLFAEVFLLLLKNRDFAMYISSNCILPKNWTVKTLMEPHKSEPFNLSIASAFYRARYIEAWRHNIQKICGVCRELGAAEPEYTVLGDDLTVKFTVLESAKTSDSKIPKYQIYTLGGKILLQLKE